ncbi:hypothetical protein ACP70R_005037 [Stipagrostis hirtigluma subsp. patula]
MSAVKPLLGKLGDQFIGEYNRLKYMRREIERLTEELHAISAVMLEVSEKERPDVQAKDWLNMASCAVQETSCAPRRVAPKLARAGENATILVVDSGATRHIIMPNWILQSRESIGRSNKSSLSVLFYISTDKESGGTISATPRPGGNSFILKPGAYHTAATDAEANGVSFENIFKLSRPGNRGSCSEGINCQLLSQNMLTGGNYVAGLKMLKAPDAACSACTNTKKMPTTAGSAHRWRGAISVVLAAAVSWLQKFFLSSPGDKHKQSIIKAVGTDTSATWIMVTGAPHHATGSRALLSRFLAEHDDVFVRAVDGVPMRVLARGAVLTDAVVLPDVWFVPELTMNMVSVSHLVSMNYSVSFGSDTCYVRNADGRIVGKAQVGEAGLYVLDFLYVSLAI